MPKGVFLRSEAHKKNIGLANKGKKKPPFTAEHRYKLGSSRRGKKLPIEIRRKIGKKGKEHWNWQGGIKPVNERIRSSIEYKLWREAVFARDDYTCRFCGQRGGELQADHIKPFAYFPELRFAIDNGRALCVDCHRKTPTWGSYKKPTKEFAGCSSVHSAGRNSSSSASCPRTTSKVTPRDMKNPLRKLTGGFGC